MHTIIHGDCLEELKKLNDNSVDAVITDPPYGLSNTKPAQVADVLAAWVTGGTEAVPAKKGGFMGKDWDSFVPPPAVWEECLRVLKPGGHMAVFAGSRTQDLMGMAIRLAGFEIRDSLAWIYGSGFPKSMDVSKAIDKAAGAEREVVGHKGGRYNYAFTENSGAPMGSISPRENSPENKAASGAITAPATPEAERWAGWGTALKPAIEPIILARKPLDGTVAANVLAHGVGGLNIDASRVPTEDKLGGGGATTPVSDGWDRPFRHQPESIERLKGETAKKVAKAESLGRFPANVLLDEHAAKEMDRQSGWQKDGTHVGRNRELGSTKPASVYGDYGISDSADYGYGGQGGASRFFPVFKYQAKAPKKERPVIEREDGTKLQHPTVKPLKLMEWLVTLTTPPGGTVLDPFAGTGTTLQAATNKGFHPIGIEADADYIKLINKRMEGGTTSTPSS